MQDRSFPALLQIVLLGSCLFFAFIIPGQLLSSLRYNQALSKNDLDLNSSSKVSVEQSRESIEQAGNSWFAGEKEAFLKGVFYSRLSDRDMPLEDKLLALCKSLSAYGVSLKHDPLDARALVRWASLRQVLGQVDCPQPYTAGNSLEVTRYAIGLAPFDPRVNYLAGKNFMWGGESEEAWRAFKLLLSYGTSVEEYKKDYIASLLVDPDDLAKLLPARFPQVIEWTERLLEQDQSKRGEFMAAMSALQQKAILESIELYNKGTTPAQVHLARLAALRSHSLEDSVLRLLNLELSRLFASGEGNEGQPDLPRQTYFEDLAKLRTIPVVLASAASDTRPAKTALRDWGNNQLVRFNQFYQSIGFFVPHAERVKAIEIKAPACSEPEFINRIRFFRSHDNQNWEEFRPSAELRMIGLEEQCLLQFAWPGSEHKYFKLNYSSAQGEGQFANVLSRLVNAYAVQN